jgi:hypothetical protein
MPSEGDTPAWVVAVEYGRKVLIWDAGGRPLIDRAVNAEDTPVSVVDTFAGRSLIHGGQSARAFDLEGKPLFDVALGDFTLSYAVGVRFAPVGAPHFALVSSTDRDTSRYRLLIIDPDRRAVYDEIFERYPRVLTARRADGSDALFVNDAHGVRLLRQTP